MKVHQSCTCKTATLHQLNLLSQLTVSFGLVLKPEVPSRIFKIQDNDKIQPSIKLKPRRSCSSCIPNSRPHTVGPALPRSWTFHSDPEVEPPTSPFVGQLYPSYLEPSTSLEHWPFDRPQAATCILRLFPHHALCAPPRTLTILSVALTRLVPYSSHPKLLRIPESHC